MKSQIMYIESLGPGDRVEFARIGRVSYSKTGRTAFYGGKSLRRIGKGEHYDVETGDRYYVSPPRRDGNDRGGSSSYPIEIDDGVREEYWAQIRNHPDRVHERVTYG